MEGIKLFELEKKRMLIETYCGYDIMRFYDGHLQQGYYYIAINRERESALALASPIAARNVINTHLRNISENQKPIYK